MKHVMLIALGLAAVAAPAFAQTSAEQLNAAELQRLTSSGTPALSMPPPAAPAATQGATQCPPGYYWEEAGYARHAKWRPAHCAPSR
ncbi:MAG TPA: hypothetical protein VG651_06685 [Stellaceae bacterium]|nr:hypothetical protein [Stellaceae bacterium]